MRVLVATRPAGQRTAVWTTAVERILSLLTMKADDEGEYPHDSPQSTVAQTMTILILMTPGVVQGQEVILIRLKVITITTGRGHVADHIGQGHAVTVDMIPTPVTQMMITTGGPGPGLTLVADAVGAPDLVPETGATVADTGLTAGHTAEVDQGPTPDQEAAHDHTAAVLGAVQGVTGASSNLVLISSLALYCLKKSRNLPERLITSLRLLMLKSL